MKCKICNSKTKYIFSGKLLFKYKVKYFHCSACGFLFTEEPYWLNEAYTSSINITDTGIMQRNIYLSRIASIIIYKYFDTSKTFLDYAGGYGIFVRLMRDIGFDFKWQDLYSINYLARGFEFSNKDEDIELLTTFESFEHFVDPISEIEKMLAISKNILFTTAVLPKKIPKPEKWWYYGLEHGQHISFYTYESLKYLAEKYNLYFYSDKNSIHLISDKKINKRLFKLIIKYNDILYRLVVKKRMTSKTFKDMENIISLNMLKAK